MDTTNNLPTTLRPVFLNPETQSAYDASNPVADYQQSDTEPVADDAQSADGTQTDSSGFSPYLSAFYKAQKNYVPKTSTNISTPTSTQIPSQLYKNLNTKFNSLGAITTEYGDTTRYEKFHPGIDIANKAGTPIPAFVPGVVTSATTGHKHGEKGFGNSVVVTDANGDRHRYSHLQQVYVKIGEPVGSGQELATMGDTGSTYSPSGKGTGTHLDYRIVDAYSKAVNPYSYLKNSI